MDQQSPNTLLDQENPLEMFLYALKAPESKRQYPKRLKVFLDFLTSKNELSHSDLENQCREFMTRSQTDSKWANKKLVEFVLFQKERVYKDEIAYATISVKNNSQTSAIKTEVLLTYQDLYLQ